MDEDMDGIGDIGHGVGINANKSVGALVAGNAELLLLGSDCRGPWGRQTGSEYSAVSAPPPLQRKCGCEEHTVSKRGRYESHRSVGCSTLCSVEGRLKVASHHHLMGNSHFWR